MLSERAGIDVMEAFTRMHRHARSNGIPLTRVAWQVLDGSLDQSVPQA